jgi:hypothetical protein
MSSAGDSATQQSESPDVLLSRLIKRLDLKDEISDFVKRYQEEQHSAQTSLVETFSEFESSMITKLRSLGLGGLPKDCSVKTALKESWETYEESVSKGSKMHCISFRKSLGMTQLSHRFEDALFDSIAFDKLEEMLGRPLPKGNSEFELVQRAFQSWRDLSTIPGYPYRPLNFETEEIRVLVVLPSVDDSATIQCKLISSDKERQRTYVALSYCWGQKDSANPSNIELEGQNFEVTPNLYSALRRLRNQTTKLYLWVDALCINQADTEERNNQVSRMKTIYQNATLVLSFLGEESNQSNIAMEFLLQFGEADNSLSWLRENWSKNSQAQVNALQALLCRDYWRRVWIMQEIVLSRNVYICCGKYIISWSSLVMFLVPLSRGDFSETAAELQMVVKAVAKAWVIPLISLWYKRRYGMRISLLDALVMSRHRKATVLHDHVYGVMGLLDTWAPRIDYGIPVPLFYIVVATAAIFKDMDGESLDALSMCKGFDPDREISDYAVRNIITEGTKSLVRNKGVSKFEARGAVFELTFQGFEFTLTDLPENPQLRKEIKSLWVRAGLETLPSWVPRLDDTSIRASHYILLNRKRNANDQASRGTLCDIHLAPGGKELVVKGLILDQVSCVSTNISEARKVPDDFEDLMASSKRLSKDLFGPIRKDWKLWDGKVNNRHRWKVWDKRNDSGTSNPYGGLDEQKDAFTETKLMGSQISETITKTLAREVIAYQAGWAESESQTVYTASESAEDFTELLACAFEHIFFISDKAFMGRGPMSMKKGDLVCILYGGRVPFILRPWGEKYYLMGECCKLLCWNGMKCKALMRLNRCPWSDEWRGDNSA